MHSAVDSFSNPPSFTRTHFPWLTSWLSFLLALFCLLFRNFSLPFSKGEVLDCLALSLSLSLMCFAFQSMAKTVSTSTHLVSHLRGACGWDRSPLSIICKVWQRMTLLILKDYFLMEQFVTGKVYTVCLCTLRISSCTLRFFASAYVLVCACFCVGVRMLNYWSSVIE